MGDGVQGSPLVALVVGVRVMGFWGRPKWRYWVGVRGRQHQLPCMCEGAVMLSR